MKRQYFPYTTSAGGAATVLGSSVLGECCGVLYKPGTTDTGATVTVTAEGEVSHTLLAKANAGTSNLWFYPRELVHKAEDGAALTGTAGGDRTEPIIDGAIKVTIASGGSTASGAVIVYYD
jgi:hypothetical protein